ncbi:hypothetical protein VTN77DRAFT_8443 [Rasamsonia byssochlamydoides]|uniref:uncharacterized protein n=1 Tax=Rasamsonia byssochlamydoides TaxID=89139 RepID=UPI0037442CAB
MHLLAFPLSLLVVLWLWNVQRCDAAQVPLAQQSSTSRSPLDDEFEKAVNWTLEHFRTPGLSIAVVRGNDTFTKGYGVSDLSTLQPVTEHTHFVVGSTTKAFTAAAISLLVDDNDHFPQIQWHTPVHNIIPDDFVLYDDWSTTHVTIEDALSHRSGLPRHDYAWHFYNVSIVEVVRKMRHLPLTAPIRTRWQYCNLMYVAMAHLIETVTGQYLGDFFRERIWGPLGMNETFMSVPEAQAAGVDVARGYEVNRTGGYEETGYHIWPQARGAGNVVSSAVDYAKWIRAMIDRAPPISAAGHAALVRAHSIVTPDIVPPESAPVTYGLGWDIHSYRGEVLIEHTGAQPGFGTGVFYLPNRQFGVALFGNNMIGGGAAVQVLAYHLIDEFLGTPKEERFDWVSLGDKLVPNTTVTPDMLRRLYPSVPDPPLPPAADVSAYPGVYVHPAYPTLNITADCPPSAYLPPFPHRAGPSGTVKICIQSLFNYKERHVEFIHVSGDFWVLGTELWGQTLIRRAEFRLGPDGRVRQLGVELEPAMAGEKIWYDRVAA